jgi:hypothetical protein
MDGVSIFNFIVGILVLILSIKSVIDNRWGWFIIMGTLGALNMYAAFN